MKKKTTYQRLKEENLRLRQNLYEVCCNPKSMNAQTIIFHTKTMAKQEDAFMRGITPKPGKNTFDGIISQIVNG